MKSKTCALVIVMVVCACVLEGLSASPLRANTSKSDEQLAITKTYCSVGSNGWLAITLKNTGAANVVITQFCINDFKQSLVNPVLPAVLEPYENIILNASLSIDSEGVYRIDVFTSQGNKFSTVQVTTTTA